MSSENADYYKYLYKYERGTSSTYVEPTTIQGSITPPLQDNPLSASAICGLSPSISSESMESFTHVIRKDIGHVSTNTIEDDDSMKIRDIQNCPPFIVDPLSLIRKLAALSKKSIGAKISIMNHEIIIHEPGMFQGLVRYYNNSNKQDLRYLEIPIETACMQYIILPTYENMREDFIKLFQEAACGLENLAKTYENNPMVAMCINHYINIIHNSISIRSIVLSKDTYDIRKYYKGSDYILP